jgi:hypothetical protein
LLLEYCFCYEIWGYHLQFEKLLQLLYDNANLDLKLVEIDANVELKDYYYLQKENSIEHSFLGLGLNLGFGFHCYYYYYLIW